jgi:hypothetical protein
MLNIPNKVPGDTHFSYEFNSYVDEDENLVTDINVALDGSDSHQLGQSSATYAAAGNYFVDSGIANAMNLISAQYNFQVPQQYYDGMLVRCLPAFTNTGACTMNVAGIGNKNIKLSGGALDPLAGDIVSGVMTSFYYSLTYDCMIYFGTTEYSSSVLYNYFSGLQASFAATTMTWDPGACSDSTNQTTMYNRISYTKDYTTTWAPGNSSGGVPSAITLADGTFYYDFIISKPDGTVDFGLDNNLNATNLLSDASAFGFTRFRRTHSHTTEAASTNNEIMYQVGRNFYFNTIRADIKLTPSPGANEYLESISIPPLLTVEAILNLKSQGTTGISYGKVYPTAAGVVPVNLYNDDILYNGASASADLRVYSTDGTVRISLDIGVSVAYFDGYTLGWADYLDT